MPCYDAGNRYIFVQCLPPQRMTLQANLIGSSQNLHSPSGVSIWMCGGSRYSS